MGNADYELAQASCRKIMSGEPSSLNIKAIILDGNALIYKGFQKSCQRTGTTIAKEGWLRSPPYQKDRAQFEQSGLGFPRHYPVLGREGSKKETSFLYPKQMRERVSHGLGEVWPLHSEVWRHRQSQGYLDVLMRLANMSEAHIGVQAPHEKGWPQVEHPKVHVKPGRQSNPGKVN